jgi:hypothetical protein
MTIRPLGPIDPAGNVMADTAMVSMAWIGRARHAVIADDRRHVGEHEQAIGLCDRQLGRGQVLIDNSFHSGEHTGIRTGGSRHPRRPADRGGRSSTRSNASRATCAYGKPAGESLITGRFDSRHPLHTQ